MTKRIRKKGQTTIHKTLEKKAKDRSSTHRSPRSGFLFQLNVAPYNSNCWLIRSKISGSFDFNTSVGGL